MTTINPAGINGVGAAAATARRGVRGAGGFMVPQADAAAAAPAALGLSEVGLAGLLALQAEAGEPVQDRAARQHGRALLAALESLQRGLLGEGVDPGQLCHLAALAGDIPEAADSRLSAVMRQIALRARIELARYAQK